MEENITKVAMLRNNEYYLKQELFDYLYLKSENNTKFYSLIKLIKDPENIRLAYRNIKGNEGSKTKGLSGKCMSYISNMKLIHYIKLIQNEIDEYNPSIIKRVGIPKANGKIRYLGIKEPTDKILEQSIYQVLEPIISAKFHNNSNGFIKGRSCRRAISQLKNYIIKDKLYYIVDIDIKSFFDNVNHGKLLKQLWASGIRDKNLLKIISKMLKAEVFKVGIPEKGTPQGGILSPLLANLVLNELDWWLESKSKKGIRFVRYADDVKLLCPTYSIARDMLEKTTQWLNKRLKLEVSEEKTKIVNLKRNYTTFLGCKIKIKIIKNKCKIISHMSDKAKENCKTKVKNQIRKINRYKSNEKRCNKEIERYNLITMGIHNYYDMNTCITQDLKTINYIIDKYIQKNLRSVLTYENIVIKDDYITNKYGNGKILPYIRGKPLIPIGRITYNPKYGTKNVCYFKPEIRKHYHKSLKLDNLFILDKIIKTPRMYESVELNDNIISKFCGQRGKYAITNEMIFDINNIGIVKLKNSSDKYNNILLVKNKVKKLIELREVDDIIEVSYLTRELTKEQLDKINQIRKENSLPLI